MPKASKTGSFRKDAAAATKRSKASTVSASGQQTNEDEKKPVVATEPARNEQESPQKDSPGIAEKQLSRGQRKRQAKREQYLRRQQLIMSSLKLKKQEDQKKRIDGLDAIKEALLSTVQKTGDNEDEIEEESDDNEEKQNLLKTNKSRKLLVQTEARQMNLVMQHPSFQQDPFATIREHLQNTLAPDAAKHKRQAIRHQKERKKKDEEKKAIKKEHKSRHKNKHRVRATRSRVK